MSLAIAIVLGVLASGGGLLTLLWFTEVRHVRIYPATPDETDRAWLECHGLCGQHRTPHHRHDDGRVTCCHCGGVHLFIPRQREASDGS